MAFYQPLLELLARFKKKNRRTVAAVTINDLITMVNSIQYAIDNAISGSGDILSNGSVPFTGQEDFQAGLKTDTISPSGTSMVSIASMLGLKVYTTVQEGLLVPGKGAMYYNSDLDAIRAYDGAAWFTVSGLSLTGSDTGATAGAQAFQLGVDLGVDSTTNGQLTFYNSGATGSVVISSDATKQLRIGNGGNDAEVGINGAAVNGIDLYVAGKIAVLTELQTPFIRPDGDSSAKDIVVAATGSMTGLYIDNTALTTIIGDAQGNGSSTKVTVNDTAQTVNIAAANGLTIPATQADSITTPLLTVGSTQFGGATVNVTSVEMADIKNTPVEILPAPAAGTAYHILSAFAVLTPVTTAYTVVNKIYIGTNINTPSRAQLTLDDFIRSGSSTAGQFVRIGYSAGNSQIDDGGAVIFFGDDNPGAGDSTLDIYVTYALVTL